MNEADFEKSLLDASQMISVLLVFLSVLFGIKYQLVVDALKPEAPDIKRPNERATFRRQQKHCFIAHVLPIGIPSVVLAALLGASFWRIVTTSPLTFLNSDLVRTIFCTIELFVVASVVWSVVVSVLLFLRMRSAS